MSSAIVGFLLGSAVAAGIAIGMNKRMLKDVNGIGRRMRVVITEQIVAMLCPTCRAAHGFTIRRLLG